MGTWTRPALFPWLPLQIDASWKDHLQATAGALGRDTTASALQQVMRHWTQPEDILVCLSVRSAFDLYLKTKRFPPGSEIACSAINIPDMTALIRHHGLVPVPFDVHLETLCPNSDHLGDLLAHRPKVVAVLVAHILGRRNRLDAIVACCQQYNVPLIEDCAETFRTKRDTRQLIDGGAHSAAELVLFSFGSIKVCTAFGGAVVRVRDKTVLAGMRQLQELYPQQRNRDYASKVLRFSAAAAILNTPSLSKSCRWTAAACGVQQPVLVEAVVSLIRNFGSAGLTAEAMSKLRHQPSVALLKTLARRFSQRDEQDGVGAVGLCADQHLGGNSVEVSGIGCNHPDATYWLFAVMVEDPEEFEARMEADGVLVARKVTQLCLVDPQQSASTPNAARFMQQAVFVPIHRRLTLPQVRNLTNSIRSATSKQHMSKL